MPEQAARYLLLWLAAALWTAGGAGGAVAEQESGADRQALARAQRLQQQLQEVIEKILPAYVFVGGGSGVIISPDGYVLSNDHVAGTSRVWKVRTGAGKPYLADRVGSDPVGDVTLLKIREGRDLPYLELADSDKLSVGRSVLAIGNAFALGVVDEHPAVSFGVITALHRFEGDYADAIQTDAPVNPGNSGGPLITLDGKLAGINGRISSRFFVRANSGVGFAVPANQIKMFLPALKAAQGRYVFHGTIEGLRLEPKSPTDRAPVVSEAQGNAKKAGFKKGDLVREIAGFPALSIYRAYGLIASRPAGATVPVLLEREGLRKTLSVTLEKQPIPRRPWYGFKTFRPDEGKEGLVVKSVEEHGPAEFAGLKKDDQILEINGAPIADLQKLNQVLLREIRVGDTVEFGVKRGEQKLVIPLYVEAWPVDRQLRPRQQ